jgi:hypothetical protein
VSAPSSIRFTEEGIKALKSLEAATGKTRVQLVSEALVEKHNRTVALAPIQSRMLHPAEILTLQAEIAALEKLHNDNRRNGKIKTSDRHALEKSIRLIEKIDSETDELRLLRLKLGKQAGLAESFTAADAKNIRTLIAWVKKRIAKATADSTADLPILETELKILTSLFP